MPDLVQTVVKRFSAQAQSKGLELKPVVPAALPHLRGDQDRLVQVLSNLVSNALQYTPNGGRVEIEAARLENQVRIDVRDTGLGIPPAHMDHVFDRFYRVDKSRSRQSGGGSGIGLTIARLLVEAHGGTIWAESAGPGRGSTFSFTVPIQA